MAFRFTDTGPKVTEADVAAFEGRLGIVLPADYRAFLLETNGGGFNDDERPVDLGGPPEMPPYRFYSLGLLGGPVREEDVEAVHQIRWENAATLWPESHYDLELRAVMWRQGIGFPFLLPIADIEHEPMLLLRLDEADRGSCWLAWDPDGNVSHDTDVFKPYHCDRVADSFGDLIDHFADRLGR